MQERLYEIHTIYITNTHGSDYSIECVGRMQKSTKLNFSGVEAIEIDGKAPAEIKHSYIQMAEGQNKVYNIRFAFPVSIIIKYVGRILIEIV